MSTPWPWIEAEALQRLNALKTDSSADAVISYELVPKTTAVVDDAAFNLTSVRVACVDTVMEIIKLVCLTEGYPRRLLYRLTALVAHGGNLPSSMGPYGAIIDPLTGSTLEDRSATEIAEMRANVNNAFGDPPPEFFHKAIDGQRLYHTLAGNALVEYFNFDRPATTYAALAALFGSMANFAPIDDEFGVVAADGSAGRAAGKAGSLISEAANFMQLYYKGLEDLGLNVEMLPDYKPRPS
jgi:hypothetical protein